MEFRIFAVSILVLGYVAAASAGIDSSAEELSSQNFYERLGVLPSASRKEIREAYGKFRRKNISAIDSNDPRLDERTRLMSEAFNNLKTESVREKYNYANQFANKGVGPEKEVFKATAETKEEASDRIARGFIERAAITPEVQKNVDRVSKVTSGQISAADEKILISFLSQKEIHPAVANAITIKLYRAQNWSPQIWQHVQERLRDMRAGQPWNPLVVAVSKQEAWPPSFRDQVELVLRPGQLSGGNVATENNMRVTAVDLLVSRRNEKPSGALTATIEAFLKSHHDSDLHLKTASALEGAAFARTANMDRDLVGSLRGTLANDTRAITELETYPNHVLQLFLRTGSLPAEVWPILREALVDPQRSFGAMNTVALLGQKYGVPESVTEVFLKQIASAGSASVLPDAFSEFRKPEYYGFKIGHVLKIDKFRCESKTCVVRLLEAARRIIGPFEVLEKGTAKLLLTMIQKSTSANLALLEDPEIASQLREIIHNAKSFPDIYTDAVRIEKFAKRFWPEVSAIVASVAPVECVKEYGLLARLFKRKK